MSLIRPTAKELYKHRKGLYERISNCTSPYFLLEGTQAYITNRYGNVFISGDHYVITVRSTDYIIEFNEDHAVLYVS